MKLLVTGASGFIGRNLLLAVPTDSAVTAQYRSSSDFVAFLKSHGLAHVQAVRADLSQQDDIGRVASISREFDSCVFLAANGDPAVSAARPAFDLISNALLLVRLVEAVQFRKLIYFSSGAVYDGLKGLVSPANRVNPVLPYAISKWAAERYLEHFRRCGQIGQSVVVRFFGAYGPYEPPRKIFTRLVRQFGIAKDPCFTIRGDGKNLIDAMYVEDAIRAILLILDREETTTTLDLCSGRPMTLTQLVTEAARAFGLAAEITFEGEVPEYIQFASEDRYFSTQHGFSPGVNLQTGLSRLHQFLRDK